MLSLTAVIFLAAYEADQRKKVLGYSPDLTSGVNTELTSVCYEYSYPDSNSNTSKVGYGRPASEHHYEQPMVILPSRSPVDSIGKPPLSETSSSSVGDGKITTIIGSSICPANNPAVFGAGSVFYKS